MPNSEARLQIFVADYLRAVLPHDVLWWANLNESQIPGPRGQIAGSLFNKMGRRKGVSDLMLLYRGILHCIELKLGACKTYGTKKTYQNQSQRDFEAEIRRCGGKYKVCRSLNEVIGALDVWGIPTRETVHA